jgi:acetyltransferase-like isoleucine patch superfamily enzyme
MTDVQTRLNDIHDRIAASSPFGALPQIQVDAQAAEAPGCEDGADFPVWTNRGGQVLFGAGVLARGPRGWATCDGAGSLIYVGERTSLQNCMLRVQGRNCIVVIAEGCRIKQLELVVRRENSVVWIGPGTTWESGIVLNSTGNIIVLGKDCMVSNGVRIRTSDSHGIFDAATGEALNEPRDVFVGDHVWLGNSCRVNKGSVIGNGTVVGQTSVVSGRLDPNAIYAGVPARKLREGIVWSRTTNIADVPPEFMPELPDTVIPRVS